MLANLTLVQERCTELKSEERVLRTALDLLAARAGLCDSPEDCVAAAREIWSKP